MDVTGDLDTINILIKLTLLLNKKDKLSAYGDNNLLMVKDFIENSLAYFNSTNNMNR